MIRTGRRSESVSNGITTEVAAGGDLELPEKAETDFDAPAHIRDLKSLLIRLVGGTEH